MLAISTIVDFGSPLTIVLMVWHVGGRIAIDQNLEVVIHSRALAGGCLGHAVAGSLYIQGHWKKEQKKADESQHSLWN